MSAFKKYAVFNGRATRKEYWIFALVNLFVAIVLSILFSKTRLSFIVAIYALFILLPSISLGVRRLHDVGKSGWMMLLAIIPFIGQAILTAYAVVDSQTGTNAYGPNPKGDSYVATSAKGLVVLVVIFNLIIPLAILAILGSLVFLSLNYARESNSRAVDKMNQVIEQNSVRMINGK